VFWEEWSDESTFETFDDLGEEVQQLDTVRGLEIGEIEAAPSIRTTNDLESPATLTIVLPTPPVGPDAASVRPW